MRNRLASQSLFINAAPSELDRTLVHFALQDIVQVCSTAIVQTRTNNLNNADSIQVLLTLAEAQETFLTTLDQHGNASDAAKTRFINEYRRRLSGLKNEVVNSNLMNAYLAQQDIAKLLSIGSEAASYLSTNWGTLQSNAVRQLIQQNPNVGESGGGFSTQRLLAQFLRSLQFPIINGCQQNSTTLLE